MITVQQIDPTNKADARRFIRFHYDLYAKCPQWVPPLLIDAEAQLDRKKHPYYEHSDADFFVALRDGKVVGRIGALENKPFNQYHSTKKANFYLFDCIDDQDVADALFERVFEWARGRGLDIIIGPKGFGPLDGYGIMVEGFNYRQTMNMLNYNYSYYSRLVENLDFNKEVDFISHLVERNKYKMPERILSIAQRVQERGTLKVYQFKNKGDLKKWAHQIGKAYNDSFVNNWEYYPLTQREIDFVLESMLVVADPKLIKVITHDDVVVGFVFAFLDLSAAMQRARGHLFPFGLIDLLLETRRTKWITFNGAGILPEFQGRGGNALLYTELEKTLNSYDFTWGELTQVAETAVQMRHDLINLGGIPHKNHRVYRKNL